ncbi:MAG: hypothetical protein ACXWP1_09860 [Bdellovibrionota bacterium]
MFSVLFFSGAMNAMGADKSAGGAAAQFFYFENVPGRDQTIVFTVNKVCETGFNKAPFRIQNFFSEKKLPASDGGEKQAVRIVHLYARYNETCKLAATEKFEQTFKVPRSSKMTHLYITTDPDVEVRSIQNR